MKTPNRVLVLAASDAGLVLAQTVLLAAARTNNKLVGLPAFLCSVGFVGLIIWAGLTVRGCGWLKVLSALLLAMPIAFYCAAWLRLD